MQSVKANSYDMINHWHSYGVYIIASMIANNEPLDVIWDWSIRFYENYLEENKDNHDVNSVASILTYLKDIESRGMITLKTNTNEK